MIFPLHRLATSSSLEHKNYLTPQVSLSLFFISLSLSLSLSSLHTKKSRTLVSAPFCIHVRAGSLEAVLKRMWQPWLYRVGAADDMKYGCSRKLGEPPNSLSVFSYRGNKIVQQQQQEIWSRPGLPSSSTALIQPHLQSY